MASQATGALARPQASWARMSAVTTGGYNAAAWLVDRHVDAGAGHRTAVVGGDERWRYDELLAQVWRVPDAPGALGVPRTAAGGPVLGDPPPTPGAPPGRPPAGGV